MATLKNSGTNCYRNAVLQLLRSVPCTVKSVILRLFTQMAAAGGVIDPSEVNNFCDDEYKGMSDVAIFLCFIYSDAMIVRLSAHIYNVRETIQAHCKFPDVFFIYFNRKTSLGRITTGPLIIPPVVTKGDREYRYVGAITHIGTRATEGHYAALIFHDNVWTRFDDADKFTFDGAYVLRPLECIVLAAYNGTRS